MNHELLKTVIFDQHEVIRRAEIVERDYTFDPNANYVLTGLRRAGKSTLLYKMARDLVASGVSWDQIIYVNFEDERLAEFSHEDFNDIVMVQTELSKERGYFFFDEIQNVDGWEKFARRLADAKERVQITGGNAKMLSQEIGSTLGGRYLARMITPYSFVEYLRATGNPTSIGEIRGTVQVGHVLAAFDEYRTKGGFPEALSYALPREPIESVYQKVLLGDIAVRNKIRNARSLRVLMKKIAETVCNEVSYTKLHGLLKAIGFSLGKSTVIEYTGYAEDAFLLFHTQNVVTKFAESEGTPRFYFWDNGLLSLFLDGDNSALLENLIAIDLRNRYGDDLCYIKSSKTGVDVDFFIPEEGLAVQAATSLDGLAREREVGSLVRLLRQGGCTRAVIVTLHEEEVIEVGEGEGLAATAQIEVIPAWKWLLR